jgi:hypothetical protein
MTQEEFKNQIEHPIKQFASIDEVEDVHFWTCIHIKATIGRTLRLALQYPDLAQEYLDSLPKAVNENIPTTSNE